MVYALVHYPKINTEQIDLLRQKYDPQYSLIAPHITIVFPIAEPLNEDLLIRHMENVLQYHSTFSVQLRGLEKSWDDYLFLLVQEGKKAVIALHQALYTQILAPYFSGDMQYVPHLTLGRFNGDLDKYAAAYDEAVGLDLSFTVQFDRVHLVKVNSTMSQIDWSKEFLLPAVGT
ncbi:MAG TPA: 2'-5' RNA ligase family protein [Caldilineaceae bacterium]|nr:2'-5' RNA ligase family protein [Caldilineaceae bacterium]